MMCILCTNMLIYDKNNLFELESKHERWQLIRKHRDVQLLQNSFSKGESCHNYAAWFTSFINCLYYYIDFPNYTITPTNIMKLCFGTIYFALVPKANKFNRIKNINSPSLEMTKS